MGDMHRRRLGRALRQLREAAGLDQEHAGKLIDRDQTVISRIERGQRGLRNSELRRLLDGYEVDDHAVHAELEGLARAGSERGWWARYTATMSPRYASYIRSEADAVEIKTWEPLRIPGLLQTEEYARAVIQGEVWDITDEELERRVEVRMTRQAELSKRHPRLWVVVDGSVLRRRVGDRSVMLGQLQRLIEVAETRSATVQIMPLTRGAHPGSGPLTILGYPDTEPDVYTETIAGDLYLEGDEAQRGTLAYDHLRASALDAQSSLSEIQRAVRELEGARDD